MSDASLRDDIMAAMQEVAAKDEPAEEVADAAASVDTGDAVSEGAEDTEPAADAADGADAHEAGAEADEAPPEEAPGLEPPEHWSAEHKDIFAALPDDDARKRFLDFETKRTSGVERKLQEAAEFRRESEELRQLMAPFEQELGLHGMTRMDGIRRLVSAEARLRQDLGAGLEWLARQYGRQVAGTGSALDAVRRIADALSVDLSGLHGAAGGEQTAEARRLAALEAEIAAQRRERQEALIAQQTHSVRSAEQAIRDFAEAVDTSGQPKHPHFDKVKVQMGALMQSGVAKDLDDAYERAVWTDPDIRAAMTKAQQDQAAKAAEATRRAAVAKAKAATTPRTASAKTAPAEDEDDSLSVRQIVERELAKRTEASRARI